MKLRTKLATLIAAFVLVAALTVVGVLAVSTATVNLGGTVNFTATDVYATVTGSVTGTSTAVTLPNITFDSTTTGTNDQATDSSWENLTWNFANKLTDIELTISVTNRATDRTLQATLVGPASMSANNVDVTTTAETAGANGLVYTIAAGATVKYKITFSIHDNNASVSGASWTATLTLKDASAVTP